MKIAGIAQDWEASGHAGSESLLAALSLAAALLAVLVFAYVVVRALVNRRRYRAVEVLTEADRKAIQEEIAAAERRTVGEIVPVVLERSDPHPEAEWRAALTTLLLGSALLAAYLPWQSPPLLLACQLVLGALGYAAARGLPDFKRRFVSERRATATANEQAFQEFFGQGLHRTEAETGVLILVSLFERRVVVLGDRGIDEKMSAGHWVKTSDVILERIRRGQLREGLVAGIQECAEVLTVHFPWEKGDRNEIRDRVVVRPE